MSYIKKLNITIVDKIIIIIIFIILITYLMIKLFTIRSEKILLNYANNKSIQISTILTNRALYEILYNYKYDSFMNTITIKDNMLDISLDNTKVNELLYLVNENILKNINLLEKGKYDNLNIDYLQETDLIFNVPIGVIYDIPILVGIGPKIPFKLDIITNSDNSVYTNIRDYGINNSIIEVILKINLNIQIILPFTSKEMQIVKEIPIDTKIIQGKVPTYYGSIGSNNN